MRRLAAIAVLAWLGGPGASWSEQAPTDVTIDRQDQWAVRLGVQGPLGAAASLTLFHGLAADVREEDGSVKAVCAAPLAVCAGGFLVEATAGSGGGKLSLGFGARARVDEEDFRGTVGVGLKASLARTWGSPIGTEPGLTYLGPELGPTGASAVLGWGPGFGL